MDPDWLGDAYRFRELVYAQAKFLTHLAGRGLLYIFAAVVSVRAGLERCPRSEGGTAEVNLTSRPPFARHQCY